MLVTISRHSHLFSVIIFILLYSLSDALNVVLLDVQVQIEKTEQKTLEIQTRRFLVYVNVTTYMCCHCQS